MSPRTATLTVLLALALGMVVAFTWRFGASHDEVPPSAAGNATGKDPSSGWSLLSAGSGASVDTERKGRQQQTADSADAEALRQRLFEEGSLRGAALDGGWGRWDGTRLQPSKDLRLRFDQLLTIQGEATLAELRKLVHLLAASDLGDAAAQAVLTQWDRYTQLLASAGDGHIDLADPQTWLAELQRQQRMRVAGLGPEWARAFYADEEQALVERIQQARAAPVAAPPDVLNADPAKSSDQRFRQREAMLGSAAALRLAKLDRDEEIWQQRLQSARDELKRLQQAPELSDLQREQAIADLLHRDFSAQEQLRARVLLGL